MAVADVDERRGESDAVVAILLLLLLLSVRLCVELRWWRWWGRRRWRWRRRCRWCRRCQRQMCDRVVRTATMHKCCIVVAAIERLCSGILRRRRKVGWLMMHMLLLMALLAICRERIGIVWRVIVCAYVSVVWVLEERSWHVSHAVAISIGIIVAVEAVGRGIAGRCCCCCSRWSMKRVTVVVDVAHAGKCC